jgi:ketosteroid isomerase-like protein
MGHATFDRDGQKLEYDYVEFYKLRDGKVVERWSFMDALPDDVKAFFG